MESEELQMDDVLGTKELSGNCQGTVRELTRGGRDHRTADVVLGACSHGTDRDAHEASKGSELICRCGAGYQVGYQVGHEVRMAASHCILADGRAGGGEAEGNESGAVLEGPG